MNGLPLSVQQDADRADALQQQYIENRNPAIDPAAAASQQPSGQGITLLPEDTPEILKERLIGYRRYHDAEITKERGENRELRAQVQQLTSENGELRSQVAQAQAPRDPLDALSEDERYDLGEHGVNALRKATAVPMQALAETREELAQIRQEKAAEQERQDQSFYSGLEMMVPNWKMIDNDPAFRAYLAQIDPDTGAERQQSLVHARNARDYSAVASIFNRYQLVASSAQPPVTHEPYQQQQPVLPATPRSPSGVYAEPGEMMEIWSEREITQLQQDHERYLRTHVDREDPARLAEFRETEQRIAQARRENRVEP